MGLGAWKTPAFHCVRPLQHTLHDGHLPNRDSTVRTEKRHAAPSTTPHASSSAMRQAKSESHRPIPSVANWPSP